MYRVGGAALLGRSILFLSLVLSGFVSGQDQSQNKPAQAGGNSVSMKDIPDKWGSYFVNVNGKLASIGLNLGLRTYAPMPNKPQLLWVWVYMRAPKPNGLSDNSEFQTLSAIEDELEQRLRLACDAVEAGRITTDGHREFYFYGTSDKGLKSSVSKAMGRFKEYKFDLGSQKDQEWNQYLNVLYPSDEDLQKMKNQETLGVLTQHGDTLTPVRDVHHWVYFRSPADRNWFASKAQELGYKIEKQSERPGDPNPFGLQFTRDQGVTPSEIDAAVIELLRLAKQVNAEYDGWEAQVNTVD
jgi:uncharacterized protein (TIGR01619 family)